MLRASGIQLLTCHQKEEILLLFSIVTLVSLSEPVNQRCLSAHDLMHTASFRMCGATLRHLIPMMALWFLVS